MASAHIFFHGFAIPIIFISSSITSITVTAFCSMTLCTEMEAIAQVCCFISLPRSSLIEFSPSDDTLTHMLKMFCQNGLSPAFLDNYTR